MPKLQLLDLASSPKGTSGALVRVHLDAKSGNFAFLEACMRFFPDGAGDDEPLFLSSGAEDYFLSASYFDEGLFKTAEAGLTYFNRTTNTLAAYKIHIEDPIVWSDGMRLRFRNCEETAGCGDMNHCPNQYCNATEKASQRQLQGSSPRLSSSTQDNAAEYSTLVFAYEWPQAATEEPGNRASAALRAIQHLVAEAHLTQTLEDSATDLVLMGDAGVLSLLTAFSEAELTHDVAARMVRQLRRYLARSVSPALAQI